MLIEACPHPCGGSGQAGGGQPDPNHHFLHSEQILPDRPEHPSLSTKQKSKPKAANHLRCSLVPSCAHFFTACDAALTDGEIGIAGLQTIFACWGLASTALTAPMQEHQGVSVSRNVVIPWLAPAPRCSSPLSSQSLFLASETPADPPCVPARLLGSRFLRTLCATGPLVSALPQEGSALLLPALPLAWPASASDAYLPPRQCQDPVFTSDPHAPACFVQSPYYLGACSQT